MENLRIFDAACFCGHWPFRKIPQTSYADVWAKLQKEGISAACFSSLDSIFYADPMEGDSALYNSLKGSPHKMLQTINPLHPAWSFDLAHGLASWQVAGVRIYPGYHDYSLLDAKVQPFMTFLGQHDLPLFISLRLEDERLNHLLLPRPADMDQLRQFLAAHMQQKIVLCNIRPAEISQLEEVLRKNEKTFVDTSGFKDGLFNVEKISGQIGWSKIIFSSLYPLYSFRSSLLQMEKAELEPGVKEAIMAGNLEGLWQEGFSEKDG